MEEGLVCHTEGLDIIDNKKLPTIARLFTNVIPYDIHSCYMRLVSQWLFYR